MAERAALSRAAPGYSPHHWLRCPVHGVTAVSRDFPDDIVQRLIDLHATCAANGNEEPMTLHLTEDRHPGTLHFAHLFDYEHLPVGLRTISGQCAALAQTMVTNLPDGPELTAGLRHLLEAKDCFVRAAVLEQAARAERDRAQDSAPGSSLGTSGVSNP